MRCNLSLVRLPLSPKVRAPLDAREALGRVTVRSPIGCHLGLARLRKAGSGAGG